MVEHAPARVSAHAGARLDTGGFGHRRKGRPLDPRVGQVRARRSCSKGKRATAAVMRYGC
jgi:hypothetical protein